MAEKFSKVIESYCNEAGVQIPSGFYRHPASRYAVINVSTNPPKLVAKTWFKQEDLAHYLNGKEAIEGLKVLDFTERQELVFQGGKRFGKGSTF